MTIRMVSSQQNIYIFNGEDSVKKVYIRVKAEEAELKLYKLYCGDIIIEKEDGTVEVLDDTWFVITHKYQKIVPETNIVKLLSSSRQLAIFKTLPEKIIFGREDSQPIIILVDGDRLRTLDMNLREANVIGRYFGITLDEVEKVSYLEI